MGIKSSAYHEIGWVRSTINKLKVRRFNPQFYLYRAKWNIIDRYPLSVSAPIHVDIETASACNLKCIMCPHGQKEYKMNKGIMADRLVKKVIQSCVDSGVKSIKLSGRGEALLHPNLQEYIRLAKKGGILDVMFNTNALLLTPEKTREILDAGIDLVIISLDGNSKETYEDIRKGSDFAKVVQNIEYLLAYRKKNNRSKPMVRLQFVRMKENIHEFDEFIKRWQEKVDVIVGIDYSKRIEQESKSIEDRKVVGRAYCPHPFRRITINVRGEALICCVDWDSKYVVGDCNTQSISEIWNGKKFTHARESIKRLQHDKIACCRKCFSPISYKWNDRK